MSMNISYKGEGTPSIKSIKSVTKALENGLDGYVKDLEDNLAKEYSLPYILATTNSTSALHLAMCALDLKRGDKVICSVNSYVNIPEVIRHFDAEPIFIDCEPFTYNINITQLQKVLEVNKSKKLRAVIINHIAGLRASMEDIYSLAKEYNIQVIEELSEVPNHYHNNQPIGSDPRTLMSITSLGDKVSGRFDAGFLLTHNQSSYDRAKILRNHGLVYNDKGASYLYDIVDIGCQYRLDEYSAIYASLLFEQREEEFKRRLEIANFYFKELQGLKHVRLPLKNEEHSYFRFIIEIDRNRDNFAQKLAKKGIEVGLHYIPLHTTRYYKDKYGLKLFDFPWAMGIYQRAISLPNRPDLTDEELNYICEAIRNIDEEHI